MARLPQGVNKRKDGLFEKRFTVNHKRYSIYAHTLDELAEKEQEKRLDIAAGIYKSNKAVTLDDYFKDFIKNREKQTKGNTIYQYKSVYQNHVSKPLGKRKVKDIERREGLELQDTISKNISIGVANRVLVLLKNILNAAVTDEIIQRNPLASIKPIKEQKTQATKTIHKALSEHEQELILQEMKENNYHYYEFFCLSLATGMRAGEIVALTWHDIDYKTNVIHVTKTLSKTKDGKNIFGSPKTKSSIRDIPINPTIKKILAGQKKKYFLNCQANGTPIDERIFLSPYGCIPTQKQLNRALSKAIASLNKQGHKINNITCHGLRDTFATRYIEQGGNPQTLKAILGHSSLAMTMDLYSQVLPNTKQEEMNRLQIKGL